MIDDQAYERFRASRLAADPVLRNIDRLTDEAFDLYINIGAQLSAIKYMDPRRKTPNVNGIEDIRLWTLEYRRLLRLHSRVRARYLRRNALFTQRLYMLEREANQLFARINQLQYCSSRVCQCRKCRQIYRLYHKALNRYHRRRLQIEGGITSNQK